jgi:hypothetical protein
MVEVKTMVGVRWMVQRYLGLPGRRWEIRSADTRDEMISHELGKQD